MAILLNALIFILILGILVLVHELGHFIAAKKQGVLVEEFGFGLPPRLFGVKIGETIYSLNLLPIGGFVKVFGEDYDEITDKKLDSLKERALVYKKPWQKAIVMIGGVIGNFLLAWILFSYLFTQGVPAPTNKVVVEKVQAGSPAEKAGIKEKDVILKIIKKETINEALSISQITPIPPQEFLLHSSNDLVDLTKKFSGETIFLVLDRSGKKIEVEIVPRKNPPKNQGPLGIVITSFIEKKYPWYQAPFFGLIEAFNITRKIVVELLKMLFLFFTFKKPQVDVAGPIGIAHFAGLAIKFGKNAVLELLALLSLNLAVINIFPFPALDGGRLCLVLYEWVTKRRVDKNFERYLNLIGFAFLISLVILISVNDIMKIYK